MADRPVNRATVAALVLWVLYLIAEEPWQHYRTPLYERPAKFFLEIGYHVAAACGLNPQDLGWVQFCSGALALIATVRLIFWVFEKRRPNA
jgi:hypothetical protein